MSVGVATKASGRASPARWAALVVALLLLLWLGLRVGRMKLAEAFYVGANLPVSYAVDPTDGMVGGYLSSALQSVGENEIASKLALAAVERTPLSARAIGTLALTSAAHDPPLSARLLVAAASEGWRDDRVQLRLARLALAQGAYASASQHLDAAADFGGANGDIRLLIDQMALSPAASPQIVRRVGLNPIWRPEYLISPAEPIGSVSARAAILSHLAALGAPGSDREISGVTLLDSLQNGFIHAYGAWLAMQRPTLAGAVYDPHFQNVIEPGALPLPFAWRIALPTGTSAEPVLPPGAPSLHVTSDGTAVGAIASELVRMSPGQHRFAVRAHYSAPGAASAFRWALICWTDKGPAAPILPETGSAVGSAAFTFSVPADGRCPLAQLVLQAQQAAQPGDAEAWFEDVQLI